jgi:hypothetical protein
VIERAFGIDVLVEGFGDEFDGLACSTSTFRLIIVNSRTPWSRQRFTLFTSGATSWPAMASRAESASTAT